MMFKPLASRLIFGISSLAYAQLANAQQPIDKDYVKSLAAEGKRVAVIEYYNGQGEVVKRRGFASSTGWVATSSTEFSVSENVKLKLYGLKPCSGNLTIRYEDFSGSCEEYGKDQLQHTVKNPKVLLCRAFISEENAPEQDVTCFSYHYIPGALDAVANVEEHLVSIGALTLVQKADGSPLREDLQNALQIGQKGLNDVGYGMWADSRTQKTSTQPSTQQ